jgi:hypothetical protein
MSGVESSITVTQARKGHVHAVQAAYEEVDKH